LRRLFRKLIESRKSLNHLEGPSPVPEAKATCLSPLRLRKHAVHQTNENFLPITTLISIATNCAQTTMTDSKLSNFDVTMGYKVITG